MIAAIFQTSNNMSEGYLILFSGLLIVFSALLMLSLFFKFGLPVLLYTYKIITKRRDKKIKDIAIEPNEKFTGEEAAAIATAIHMYFNAQHDYENPILTIKQAQKSYSPWSSKIYGTQSKL